MPTSEWFLLCLIDPPSPVLVDGENISYMTGSEEEIDKEFTNAVLDGEYPFIFKGKLVESAVSTYEIKHHEPCV
jgi:hypothetical protein